MRVVMVRPQYWQDAGQERLLEAEQAYDVPDAVGRALVLVGTARSVVGPAETKPMGVTETKRGRRR